MMKGNFGFRLKYKSRNYLNALIGKLGGNGIYGIKGPKSQKDKNALVIYTAEALSKYLSNTLSEFREFQSHSGFQESIALLNSLLDEGFTVDYLNLIDTPNIIWEKYQVVIDAGNNLEKAKEVRGQKRIYYATGCHWRTFYANAYTRCDSFYRRNGILLYPDRQLVPNYSDDVADIITCFGGIYQKNSFLSNSHKVQEINLSTTYLPNSFEKKITSKNKFIWYGGYGPLHKGLDIVVEAFKKMPDMTLHILGNLEHNPKFLKWFEQTTGLCANIRYHGWIKPDSKKFHEFAEICDAIVFTSSSEGGAGSVIQCLQFGLLPILNKSTALDIDNNQFIVTGDTPDEEIESVIQNVKRFSRSDTDELQKYSEIIQKKYCTENTLVNYSKSLTQIIRQKT